MTDVIQFTQQPAPSIYATVSTDEAGVLWLKFGDRRIKVERIIEALEKAAGMQLFEPCDSEAK